MAQNPYGFDYDPNWRTGGTQPEEEETAAPSARVSPGYVPPRESTAEDLRDRYGFDVDPNWRTAGMVAEEGSVADIDPTWGDYGRIVMAGGAQIGSGIGWLLDKFNIPGGESLQEAGASAAEWWMEGISPQAQAALQTEFTQRDRGQLWTDAKWNKAKLIAAQSLLGTAGGMGLGSLFTKGLAKAGMTRTVTTAAGATAQVPTRTAGAIGYGLGEAGVAAPSAAAGVEAEILGMSHDQLYPQSLEYQLVYDALEGTPEDRERRAKEMLAKAAAGDTFALSLVSTFILSAPAGTFMSKVTAGMPIAEGGGRIAGGLRGAGTEAAQEFGQSYGEAVASNIGMRRADPTRPYTEGALEEAVGGALAGGIMGAGPGLAASPERAITGVADPNESPLAALDQPDRPDTPGGGVVPVTRIDPHTGEEVTPTGDPVRDRLDMEVSEALLDLELTQAEADLAEQIAETEAKPTPVGVQEYEIFEEREAAEAAQREAEEAAAREQQAEQIVAQAEAEAEPVPSEMVTPRGIPVEQQPIDVIAGQPAEGMRTAGPEEALYETGGRPPGTSLGEVLREAGVRRAVQQPPQEPGPPGPPSTPPEIAPEPDLRDVRAAEALMREEEQRALDEEAEAGYPEIPFTDEEIAARRPPDDEGPPPPPAAMAVEKPKPEPEITEAVAEPVKPTTPKPTKRPNYARDNFTTTRAKLPAKQRLSMEKFEAEGFDMQDMREHVYGGKPAFSRHPDAMGPDDVAEYLNENDYPNPFDNGSIGTWDANQAIEAVRDEMTGVSEILTGEAIENRQAEAAYEQEMAEFVRAQEQPAPEPTAPAPTEEQEDMFGAPSATAQAVADAERARAERERTAPEADMGVPGDLFTAQQTREQEQAQVDVEEAAPPGMPEELPLRPASSEELDALADETLQDIERFLEQGEQNMGWDRSGILASVQKLKLHKHPRAAEVEAQAQPVITGETPAEPAGPIGLPPDPTEPEMRGTVPLYDEVLSRMDFTNPVPLEQAQVGDTIGGSEKSQYYTEHDPRYGFQLVLDIHPKTGSKLTVGLQSRGPMVDPAKGNKPVTRDAGLYFSSEPYQGYGVAHDTDYTTLQEAIDEFRAAGDQQVGAEAAEAAEAAAPPPGAPPTGEQLGFDDMGPDTEARVFQAIPPIDVKKRVAIDTRLKREGNKFITPEQAEDRLNEWEANAIEQGKSSREGDRGPQNHKDNFNRVIISLFDTTGKWANPYALAGYDVRTLDIKQGIDVTDFSIQFLEDTFGSFEGKEIYGVIAACPCTTFANSSTKWRRTDLPPDHPQNRHENQDPEWSRHWIREMWGDKAADAVDENGDPKYATPHDYAIELVAQTIRTLEYLRPQFWAVENPEGRIEEAAGLPNPWRTGFQPHNFGDPYTKRTLLWGNFNDDLPTANVDPVEGSKMHMMSPSAERTAQRSETPEGFALAFFQANNYLDTDPRERTMKDYWYVAGAINAAFEAGVTEDEIRAAVYLDQSYEPESEIIEGAKATIRELIEGKGGPPTTPGAPPAGRPPSGLGYQRQVEIMSMEPAALAKKYDKIDLQAMAMRLGLDDKGNKIEIAKRIKDEVASIKPGIAESIPSEAEIEAVEAETVIPTEAQAEAGNYKKPEMILPGNIPFRMETAEGVKRKGYKQAHPYGYFSKTKGADGDPIDGFINKKMAEDWAGDVYIVDQQFPGVGGFDEHKVMFGFNNLIDARRGYRKSYGKDWKGVGPVTKMSLEEFKTWLAEPGAGKKPAALSKVVEKSQKARDKQNKDLKYAAGRDLLNAPNNLFVKKVLEGGERMMGDVPDTVPLQMAVSELLALQEQREGAPAAPARPDFGEIEQAIQPVEDRLPGAPVTLLHNYKQAPLPVVKAMDARGLTQVKAVFDPESNRIYMFADQIRSVDEGVRTSLHEKAHQGLRVAFGEQLDPLLDDIYRNASERRQEDMQTIVDKYKIDTSTAEGRREAAEELLAHMAEHNVNDGMVNRAVAFIRKILRNMGLVQEFTDNDIRSLIREAQGAISRRVDRTANVVLEEEVILEDTGEVFIIEQDADVALTGINQRIEICKKVRKCL